ncbi:bifunctional lysylphosphatidylglycerol flippase/synthetase MprF [Alloyangia pacifica]|uniref:bifunctional lysylphosphatidylglycerol flippase/synthetase MprF n=1 Tax=Alloyangia pacifica TaxID=311180 RepID=UPI001CD1F1E4|nr:bifunctional lysylphosphatidylglycerol flippase/synthetase MprF [Alloyangia pacifica]MCA0998617.1 bifunctional lysylphosphatidylglycerol flippase/synthetase MprF [Alloyangia pacifica]
MTDASTAHLTPWQRVKPLLPYIVTAALFGAGAFALYRLLAPVDLRSVLTQARATPWHILALAVLTTFASYAALIGYDRSALRYIGKDLPGPVVALGSFLGYAFGNTIGAGPITGGAVRYRVYSALGLSTQDIAAIAAFASVAFGFGATIIGFGALAIHPLALGHLLPFGSGPIRYVSLAVVIVVTGLLFWIAFRRTEITVRGVTLRAPTPGLMAAQFVFTAVDMLLAATTLYLLLPPSELGFATFLAVYAAAVMAGVLSHVPGGVGVLETVVIAALPASVPVEQAATGLLLYRIIYYLLPFAVALVLLALTEARMASSRAAGPLVQSLAPLARSVSALVPLAMAAMMLGSGLLLMVSSLLPPTSDLAEELEVLTPLAIAEGGALLASIFGAMMLVIAHGLLRRVQGAWWLAVLALAGGIVASLANALDIERAVFLGAALLILWPTRREFFRTTRLTRQAFGLRWLLLITALGASVVAVLFFAHKATPYAHELWWQFATDASAPRALRAALVGMVVLVLSLLVFALRPGRLTHALPTAEELAQVRAIVAAQPDPEANIALTGDKCLMVSESGRAALMYRIRGRSWIALHEPFGEPSELAPLAWDFHDAAYAANARPVFYSVGADLIPLWLEMGLGLVKLGEEAVVPLPGFSLQGPERKRLRTAHNRALRDGLSFEVLKPPFAPGFMEELRAISDSWLATKAGAEKGFSVGAFDPDVLSQAPIAVVRHEGRTVAFANLWLTETKTSATIDLMRHVENAPGGLMEFLFTELLLHFAAEGYDEFSLGNAPLSGLEARRGAALSTRLGALVYRHGQQFYNFEGLRAFKEKFGPDWRPIYVAVPPRANLLSIAADVVALIGGGARKGDDVRSAGVSG